ncbi:MAG: general secretion pathway protein GspB [Pseudomonadota bacterium]
MSMILDALTRAEHERQLENQPDLKFVNPVKPNKTDPKKIWVWVACALIANALILFLVVRALTNDEGKDAQLVSEGQPIIVEENISSVNQSAQQSQQAAPITTYNEPQPSVTPQEVEQTTVEQTEDLDSRPLAMEANNVETPEVDRPLIYESKQAASKPKNPKPQQTASTTQSTKKGNVSFSTTELSADDALPIVNTPKLLIDQGVEPSTQVQSTINAPSLRDLPESTRTNLKQYEVNVHVFDDEPIRRFVLINMNKYKEGDRIANNGPLVEQITADGVVVDYGSGRALLPPK